MQHGECPKLAQQTLHQLGKSRDGHRCQMFLLCLIRLTASCRCVLRGKSEAELTKLGMHMPVHRQRSVSHMASVVHADQSTPAAAHGSTALTRGPDWDVSMETFAGECPLDPGGYFIVRVCSSSVPAAAEIQPAMHKTASAARQQHSRQPANRQSLCALSPPTLCTCAQEPLSATGTCMSAHHL